MGVLPRKFLKFNFGVLDLFFTIFMTKPSHNSKLLNWN